MPFLRALHTLLWGSSGADPQAALPESTDQCGVRAFSSSCPPPTSPHHHVACGKAIGAISGKWLRVPTLPPWRCSSSFFTLFLARGCVLISSDSPCLSGLYPSGPAKCKHRGFHGALPWVELVWGLLKSWLEGAVRTFGRLESGQPDSKNAMMDLFCEVTRAGLAGKGTCYWVG